MTTIERLRHADPEASFLLVLHPSFIEPWQQMCATHGFSSPTVVAGGATRWESVSRALAAADPAADIITIHDGARPVVAPSLLKRVVEKIEDGHQGALPLVPLTDSVRRVADPSARHSEAVDRATLRAVQTPQAFSAQLLREAYRLPYRPQFTDDASVMEAAGFTDIVGVDGDPMNIKVTHPGDLEIATLYLSLSPL